MKIINNTVNEPFTYEKVKITLELPSRLAKIVQAIKERGYIKDIDKFIELAISKNLSSSLLNQTVCSYNDEVYEYHKNEPKMLLYISISGDINERLEDFARSHANTPSIVATEILFEAIRELIKDKFGTDEYYLITGNRKYHCTKDEIVIFLLKRIYAPDNNVWGCHEKFDLSGHNEFDLLKEIELNNKNSFF